MILIIHIYTINQIQQSILVYILMTLNYYTLDAIASSVIRDANNKS